MTRTGGYLRHQWRNGVDANSSPRFFSVCLRCGADTRIDGRNYPPPWYTDLPLCWQRPD